MSSVMSLSGAKDTKTKEERIQDFIKSIAALEQAIEPFREQMKDLKKSYVSNVWLSKDEVKSALKAYRLMKSDTDFAQLEDMYNKVSKGKV